MMSNCSIEACQFARVASSGTLTLELIVIILSLGTAGYLYKAKQLNLLKRFGLMALGVLIFELFTQPLWNNHNMSNWAYLYIDISWILTLAWTLILYYAFFAAEKLFGNTNEGTRFFWTLVLATIDGILLEIIVVKLGIRTYSPEVLDAVHIIPNVGIAIEAFFYIPVFMALVLSFARYWELIIGKVPMAPHKSVVHGKSIVVAFIGVLLYEIMNEPAVANPGWPSWSYIYNDVNLIRIVLWVIILAAGSQIITKFCYRQTPYMQHAYALILLTIFTIPVENLLVTSGMRTYSDSLQSGFYGVNLPGTSLPAELLLAIPLYATLIIAFVRYWVAVWEKDIV